MSEITWGVFQSNYNAKILTIFSYNPALRHATESAVGAERALFPDARTAVTEISPRTKNAFNDVSSGSVGDVVVAARIGSAAVDAAATIAKGGGPLGVGKAVVDFGLAVIDTKPEEADISKMGNTSGEIMQGSEDALSDMNTRMYNAKNDLNQRLQSNLEQINSHGSDYGIVFEGFDTSSTDELKIKKEGDGTNDLTVNTVTNTNLPTIADELSDAVPDLATIKDTFPKIVNRPDSIGLGVTGPAANFCSSINKLITFVKELSYETSLAKHNLELAVEDLTTQDGSSKAELERL